MTEINKTLYIPLYGKAFVSRKGIILADSKAEEIWDKASFALKGKSASKWLAYYMGMRSAVFDLWLKEQLSAGEDVLVLHIGCGLDSRVLRVKAEKALWYDVDFPQVIEERRGYYQESHTYHMLAADIRDEGWLSALPKDKKAVVIMEGVSMYLRAEELKALFENLSGYFESVSIMVDCYTEFAAKASKYKNPINDVGVTQVYGLDEPEKLENAKLELVKEHEMCPRQLIDQLQGAEKSIFKKLYAGGIAKKMYRLYEYKSK